MTNKTATHEIFSKILSDVKAGKYDAADPAHRPRIVADDEAEQALSIPILDGTDRVIVSRKPSSSRWSLR